MEWCAIKQNFLFGGELNPGLSRAEDNFLTGENTDHYTTKDVLYYSRPVSYKFPHSLRPMSRSQINVSISCLLRSCMYVRRVREAENRMITHPEFPPRRSTIGEPLVSWGVLCDSAAWYWKPSTKQKKHITTRRGLLSIVWNDLRNYLSADTVSRWGTKFWVCHTSGYLFN